MANGFNAYQREMARRGLGSVFQTEGPERVGAGQRFTRSFDNREAGRANLTDVYGPDIPPYLMEDIFNVGGLLDQIVSAGSETITPQPMTTAERRQQGAAIRREAAAPKTGLEEAEFFPSGLDPDKWQTPEDFVPFQPPKDWNVIEAKEPPKAGVPIIGEGPKKSMLAGGRGTVVEKPGERAAAIDTAFVQAMQEFNKAAGKEDDTAEMSDAELLEKYKKEFADATGIDVSGKVDKSQALMAFGLALMQNRAGKGFNVGNMLRAVGEAGEAALPALEKAKQEAKAAKLAAGKYALEQIKAGKSAEAALAKEMRERAFEWALEERKLQAEAEKAALKGIEYKNVADREILPEVKVAYGIDNGNTVLAKPSADASVVANSWNKYTRGEEVANTMMGLLEDFSASSAPTIEILADRARSVLSSLGIARPSLSLGPDGATKEQKFNALKLSVINEMKKIILQESQVSDFDRKTLDASFGVLEAFKTPEEGQFALQEMINFFASRKSSLNGVLQQMYDPSYYRSAKEYERTTSFLNDNMSVPYIRAPEPNGPSGPSDAPIATIDLNKRGS